MQASRLLSVLMLLQARGRMTAPALASAVEVSVRTILRDIDQLSAAGVPIWSERGRQGGFQLRAGWSTQLTGMTESEANALLLAGLPGAATELGLGASAASARLKLLASLPNDWREQAARVGERLHVDPLDWYRAKDSPKFLREIADAVWNERCLSVRYESWRGAAWHELQPLGLVLKAGAWYLIASSVGRPATRTFRLASILELRCTVQQFRRPVDFDLARTWQESSQRFESSIRVIPARVRVSARGLIRLNNARIAFTSIASAERSMSAGLAEWEELEIALESIEHGARELLGLGAEIEVLAPAELRTEVLRLAVELVARYQSAGVHAQ